MRLLLIFLFSCSPLAGEYEPPNREAMLFRRDAIPLDADRQQDLAEQLLKAIPRPAWNENPAQERASAQLISLARQLEADTALLRKTERQLRADNPGDIPTAEQRLSILREIERYVLFLQEQERETQAYHLATLILDPLAVIAPGLPVVTLRNFRGEEQRWQGVFVKK